MPIFVKQHPLDKSAVMYYHEIERELTKQAVCSHIVKLKNNRHVLEGGAIIFALLFVNKGYKHMKNRIAAGNAPESNAVFLSYPER